MSNERDQKAAGTGEALDVKRVLLPTNDWRNWKIKGCLRDQRGVLRLVIEDWHGNQYLVMAVEAPDWQPLTELVPAAAGASL